MVKVGILTWHKTLNHGAVLQAYASQKVLEGLGYEPVLLDYERASGNMDNTPYGRIKRWTSKLSPNKLKTVFATKTFTAEKAKKFEAFRQGYLVLGDRYDREPSLDVAMIGSDMVFDFYEGYNPFMYGKGVDASYIFTYAACFGYATRALIDSFEYKGEIASLLKQLNFIGYRDENTHDLVRYLAPQIPTEKNIDPVLLYAFSREREIWSSYGWAKAEPYVLVYAYTYNLDSPEEITYIREIAQKLGCRVVAVGYCHLWCDEVVNADPREFVELFENARLVVTDTFHGTVFSLAFDKEVRVIVRRNAFKVLDLLDELDITNQVVVDLDRFSKSNNASDVRGYDHAAVQERISDLRKASKAYLRERIKEVDCISYD